MAALLMIDCGRLSFESMQAGAGEDAATALDATPSDGDGRPADGDLGGCVPSTPHDEDSDLRADACDPCPLRADDGADVDADGVGDACDPWPATPERIILFDPFVGQRPEWVVEGAFEFRTDEIRMDGRTSAASGRLLPAPGREVLEFTGRGRNADAGDHAAALEIGAASGLARYGCEVGVVSGAARLAFTSTLDQITYTTIAAMPMATTLASNEVRLTLELTPPNVRCEVVMMGELATVSGIVPGGFPAEVVRLTARGVEVEVDGFVRAGETAGAQQP